MTPEISVIVPVYRVEAYLGECLESIAAQTFQNFELILVDDGSDDGSGMMCDAYAQHHPNTRVLHQSNQGLSEARNQGVQIARGEYVVFIDSDDYVSPDHLQYLLELMKNCDADVAVAEVVKFTDGKIPLPPAAVPMQQCLTPEEALRRICYAKMGIFACCKMYRRALVEKHPYPQGALYEDTATTYKLVGDARAVAYGNKPIYFWRQREDSITHVQITPRHLVGITAAKEQLSYMQSRYPQVVPAARARCVMKIVDLSYRLVMGTMDRQLFEQVRAELKPFLKPVLADPKAGRSLKIRALALSWGYLPYRAICKAYATVKKSN